MTNDERRMANAMEGIQGELKTLNKTLLDVGRIVKRFAERVQPPEPVSVDQLALLEDLQGQEGRSGR